MQEPWEYFADGIARRLVASPTEHGSEDAARMSASREAAESLIAWLTGEQGWPWAAARILAAKLMDRALLWTFLDESLGSLRADLRLIWEAERESDPGRAAWSRLMRPLLGTPLASAPVRPAERR
jgi:hypothetical protein